MGYISPAIDVGHPSIQHIQYHKKGRFFDYFISAPAEARFALVNAYSISSAKHINRMGRDGNKNPDRKPGGVSIYSYYILAGLKCEYLDLGYASSWDRCKPT